MNLEVKYKRSIKIF